MLSNIRRRFVSILALMTVWTMCTDGQYQPNWASLDARPLPAWFDDAKFGIFIHWGVFSVPSFGNEWFQENWAAGNPDVVEFMRRNYPPDFTYADFAPMFKAEFFNPQQWADIFEAAGARYVVFTSKHIEGYTNWPSANSFNWNSMDVGPKRDIVGDLAKAIKSKPDLRLGLYHSMMDWFNPLYLQDKANGWKTNKFAMHKAVPELYELIYTYQPELIWGDGAWEAPDTYWNSTEFLAWLYNESPVKDVILVNDRWGTNTECHHGGYMTCTDKFNPGVLQPRKWENCMTIDRGSWGFRRNAQLSDYLSIEELIGTLASTVSCGGNLLMNVGPQSDGMISPIFEERLRQFGSWLKVNGEAIYSSKPWTTQKDTVTSSVWYTSKGNGTAIAVYAIVLSWPTNGVLSLGAVRSTDSTTVQLLGYLGSFTWKIRPSGGIDVMVPAISIDKMPCLWAWVFKLTNV